MKIKELRELSNEELVARRYRVDHAGRDHWAQRRGGPAPAPRLVTGAGG